MSAKGEQLIVLVPCLNEATTIGNTVDEILALRPKLPMKLDVLLIDDGSRDGTFETMQQLAVQHGIRATRNETNRGVGRSILDAYETLPGDAWATVVPGDGEIVFASILNYVELRDRYDIILGYLHNPVIRTMSRRLASYAFTRSISALYGFDYRYLNGLKMYRVSAFQDIKVHSGGHAFNAELLGKAILRDPHLRIGEVPFMMRGRRVGTSRAIQPSSVARAIREVVVGYRSVSRYRDRVITKDI